MAGTGPILVSSMATAMMSNSAAAMAGAGGSVRLPTQVLSELLGTLTTLLATEVTTANEVQHNA